MRKTLIRCLALLTALLCLPLSSPAQSDREYLQSAISVLTDDQIPRTPSGVHHYLLIGMDKWQNNPENMGFNDGLVLLTLDELSGRVMLTSFIRDMLVIRPDGTPGRINRVSSEYGVQGDRKSVV